MKSGSLAEAWFNLRLHKNFKKVYSVFKAHFLQEFLVPMRLYVEELKSLKLRDRDIGVRDDDGAMKHAVFAKKALGLVYRIPDEELSNNEKLSIVHRSQ